MKSIQALREQRNNLAKELRNHYDKFDGDNAPKWDEKADETFKNLQSQIEDIDAKIANLQSVLDVEASKISATKEVAGKFGLSEDEVEGTAQKNKEIFNAYVRGGISALSAEQQAHVYDAMSKVQNTMSTGTGSEGGFLVPELFAAQLIERLKAFGGMRSVAQVISTESGANLPYPTTDATSEEGEIIAENTEVADQDATFGVANIGAFMFSSKGIAIPFQLLQDSAINIEGHLNDRLATRLNRITNRMYTAGTGTSQPLGAVPSATSGKVGATGKSTSVDFSDINDLVHSVDPAYRQGANCSLMFHDNTLRDLKDIRDTQNRPLWLPGIAQGEPDTIFRYRYTINQNMPVMAADAKSILFGDFSKFIIRDVRQLMLYRMTDSAYTRRAQVGFIGFLRSDGRLIDVNALKYYQNSAS